jgi:hypothetical protein
MKLLQPLQIGPLTLPNRVFMAPLTRLRSLEPGDVPTALMAEYYRQRASAGLIITEATQISFQAKGYSGSPGIHSAEQIAAWRTSTKPSMPMAATAPCRCGTPGRCRTPRCNLAARRRWPFGAAGGRAHHPA